jgi:hypothetical protein
MSIAHVSASSDRKIGRPRYGTYCVADTSEWLVKTGVLSLPAPAATFASSFSLPLAAILQELGLTRLSFVSCVCRHGRQGHGMGQVGASTDSFMTPLTVLGQLAMYGPRCLLAPDLGAWFLPRVCHSHHMLSRKFYRWPGQKIAAVDMKPRNISFGLHRHTQLLPSSRHPSGALHAHLHATHGTPGPL